MALNPNIILQGQTPKFDMPDPIAQYSKGLQLKGLMQQQTLQDQAMADDQATRSAYQSGGGDTSAVLKSLMQGGNYKAAAALQKQLDDQAATQSKTGYQNAQTGKTLNDVQVSKIAQHRDELANVNSPQDAMVWAKQGLDQGLYPGGQQQYEAGLQVIQDSARDPLLFNQWKQQAALGATKFIEQNAPKYQTNNLGGKTVTMALPGLGGAPTMVASQANSQSPDSAANTAVQIRGQNMVDARARDTSNNTGDDQSTENIAQMIASGRMAPLGQMALRSPQGLKIMSRVQELNPDFRAQDFGTASKAEKDFATGKQGNSVRSFNVSLTHLDTLANLADALNNGNTQLINKFGNAVASQTGNSAPTNFDAAKKIVADEIVKAIVGSGGGVADREEASRVISAANSPEQLKGVIGTYKELMAGQLHGLNDQYTATTGRNDFEKYLSPQARTYVSSKKPQSNSTDSGAKPSRMATPIKTADDYNKLPSGAMYIDPQGKTRQKP